MAMTDRNPRRLVFRPCIGDFHTDAALTVAVVSTEFVLPVSSKIKVLEKASMWCVMLNAMQYLRKCDREEGEREESVRDREG